MNNDRWYLSTIDPEAQILAAKYRLGLEFSEFCTAWNLDDHFSETDRSVREKMAFTDRYALHGPFNELFPCAIDKKARQLASFRFRQALGTAGQYGISKVVLHAGFQPASYYPQWFEEQSILFWKEFLESIPLNMTICLENVMEPEPGMIVRILRAVGDSRLRMCLDIGHAHVYSRVSVKDWIFDCRDLISHFHIHNNDRSRDTHSALSEGTIPMEAVLNLAAELCPEASFTLELPNAAGSLVWLKEHNILEDFE